MTAILSNLQATRQAIAQAAQAAQRSGAEVRLLAVSKTLPAAAVREAYQAGQTAFGENYLQEALDKTDALRDLPLEWHFIGPIQSNKTRLIANAGRRVVRLEYEAHESMALREMRRLGAAARRRWRLRKVAMVHRVGAVPVGEPSVVIAVSAGHRDDAFAAGRWLIERLKEIVPIWKKERYRGGAVWIGAQQGGPSRRRAIYPARRGR